MDNQALEFVHVEDSQGYTATDSELPIPTEQSVDWEPLKFSSIMVQSATQTNDYGHLMGYEFLPGDRTGTGRFSQRTQDKEMWTQHDQYLTNDNSGEDGSGSGYQQLAIHLVLARQLSAELSERRTDRRDRRRNRAVVYLLGAPRAH